MPIKFNLEQLQHKALKWINNYYLRIIPKNRPSFHAIEKVCPELLSFDRHFDAIKNELETILYDTSIIPKYSDIDEVQLYNSDEISEIKDEHNEAWKIFMLYLMGENLSINQAKCPVTTRILKSIPNVYQVFFSVLEGGKSIYPHNGPYLGYLRYHLAFIVPEINPPYLIVAGENYTWEQRKSMMFDDSLTHEVVNESNQMRVVLIVDILRPMSKIPHYINWIVTRVFIKNLYGRVLVKNIRKFRQGV